LPGTVQEMPCVLLLSAAILPLGVRSRILAFFTCGTAGSARGRREACAEQEPGCRRVAEIEGAEEGRWWPGPELNWGHPGFQPSALPAELPGHLQETKYYFEPAPVVEGDKGLSTVHRHTVRPRINQAPVRFEPTSAPPPRLRAPGRSPCGAGPRWPASSPGCRGGTASHSRAPARDGRRCRRTRCRSCPRSCARRRGRANPLRAKSPHRRGCRTPPRGTAAPPCS